MNLKRDAKTVTLVKGDYFCTFVPQSDKNRVVVKKFYGYDIREQFETTVINARTLYRNLQGEGYVVATAQNVVHY